MKTILILIFLPFGAYAQTVLQSAYIERYQEIVNKLEEQSPELRQLRNSIE